ncbi:50S ribosomal protein L24 [Jiulongibacter sediminis]|jgi:large subunit ribosomal protein L24|uniref:Large ribosomal subunit protein uL24 n=1 Tax=Jiulongibacter sediminis TaxID=1605367 RepID=A0A0N8HAD6_9BACT|nr:50S ribosomal protein L24 [Jiulongibacter sediminis]KPM49876.1 50S ribosomal protein L24 [Jiulongibacter sediminis]TBX26912.1 50S ribosomal protein L24 [Jiulongibacter sediminis]
METKNNKMQKRHVRTGDTVQVIAGNSKGKQGKVVEVLTKKDRVIVEGINMIKKHVKPNAQNPQGEIQEVEGSIHISNVQVLDPESGKPSRTGRKANDKGKLQRFAKSSGKFI